MFLLQTFTKLQHREFCLFQYIISIFHNTISQSENKFASEYLRSKKKKNMSAGKKTIQEKQTILLESIQRLN